MSELDEIKDIMKESGTKSLERKIGKREKIAVTGTFVVIAILISVQISQPHEEYTGMYSFQFNLPDVNWNSVNDTYILKRSYNSTDYIINRTIANRNADNKFEIEIFVDIECYRSGGSYDSMRITWYVCGRKMMGVYCISKLELHFHLSDDKVAMVPTGQPRKVHNLSERIDSMGVPESMGDMSWTSYYLYEHHRYVGVNKDGVDIYLAKVASSVQINIFDSYPNWTNHTITFTAILYYGKYVSGWFGYVWQDVHKISASVTIYIVAE